MNRIITLICIRSLYPHFLFKRGSVVHVLFMIFLFVLLASSYVGMFSTLKYLLDAYNVPFSLLLASGAGAVGLWGLVLGIRYGVAYA